MCINRHGLIASIPFCRLDTRTAIAGFGGLVIAQKTSTQWDLKKTRWMSKGTDPGICLSRTQLVTPASTNLTQSLFQAVSGDVLPSQDTGVCMSCAQSRGPQIHGTRCSLGWVTHRPFDSSLTTFSISPLHGLPGPNARVSGPPSPMLRLPRLSSPHPKSRAVIGERPGFWQGSRPRLLVLRVSMLRR